MSFSIFFCPRHAETPRHRPICGMKPTITTRSVHRTRVVISGFSGNNVWGCLKMRHPLFAYAPHASICGAYAPYSISSVSGVMPI